MIYSESMMNINVSQMFAFTLYNLNETKHFLVKSIIIGKHLYYFNKIIPLYSGNKTEELLIL